MMMSCTSNQHRKMTARNVNVFYADSENSSAFFREVMEHKKCRRNLELHEGQLKWYIDNQAIPDLSARVISVEQRRGTNIIILGCGPDGRLLKFVQFDTKKQTDEWLAVLCGITRQDYGEFRGPIRRARTDIKSIRDKKPLRTRSGLPDTLINKIRGAKTAGNTDSSYPKENTDRPVDVARPTFPPIELDLTRVTKTPGVALTKPSYPSITAISELECVITEQGHATEIKPDFPCAFAKPDQPTVDDFSDRSTEYEGSKPPFGGPALQDSQDSHDTIISEGSSLTMPLSPSGSLRSGESFWLAPIGETKEIDTEELRKITFMDHQGKIYVQSSAPGCELCAGDRVRISNIATKMNAEELTKYIQNAVETNMPKVLLDVSWDSRCVVRAQRHALQVDVRVDENFILDAADFVRKVCLSLSYTCNGQRGTLLTTNINKTPVSSTSAQTEEMGMLINQIPFQGQDDVEINFQTDSLVRCLSGYANDREKPGSEPVSEPLSDMPVASPDHATLPEAEQSAGARASSNVGMRDDFAGSNTEREVTLRNGAANCHWNRPLGGVFDLEYRQLDS